MSKFIDKLNRLSRAEPQPIGFRMAQTVSPRLKIQLVASLAQENIESLTDHIAGADAGLLRISKFSSGAKALQTMSQAIPDIPWGGWLPGGSPGEIAQMVEAGCDFVVFPATSTPLAVLQSDEVGRILEIDASLGEGLLRATNELPVDAVLVTGEQLAVDFLTWQHLILCQRLADLLIKPLLVSIPAEVTAAELQALWAAGVKGVIAEITPGQPQDRLQELRQIIDQLVFPSPRQREKAEHLLHRIGQESGRVTIEEEEEEEEE